MGKLTAEEIVELSKRYTLYDWQAQSKVVADRDRPRGGHLLLERRTASATSTSTAS